MNQRKFNFTMKLMIALVVLLFICIFSLSYGDSSIGFINSVKALFGYGDSVSITIVQNVRAPRVLGGLIAGSTLAVSGLFTRIALKNPLADSSILGIQSGASVMALLVLLVFPAFAIFLPLFAFLGGFVAYLLVISFSYRNGFSPMRLVLSGVAINSFFTAITSVITVTHVNELQNSINWTSGSLVGISLNNVLTMGVYALIALILAIFLLPMLELLRLDDNILISLGKSPNLYRFLVSVVAVLLASISLSYVGLIAFVGIIVPHISQMVVGNKVRHIFIMTLVIGGILVVGVDLLSRIIFVSEIPVGALIGVLGAPLFLYLLRGEKNGI